MTTPPDEGIGQRIQEVDRALSLLKLTEPVGEA
jgi:hypothetical protein